MVCCCAVSCNSQGCIGLAACRCADTFSLTAYRRGSWTAIVNLKALGKSGSTVHQILSEASDFTLFRADIVCLRRVFVHSLE